MSTHSAIIIKTGPREYRGIYVHFDGYLKGVGHTLLDHYKTKKKILELLKLGDLKTLGPNIEHSGSKELERNETEAFHRDCGETLNPAKVCETLVDIETYFDHEYSYVFKNGKWFYRGKVLTKKTKDGNFEE